MNIYETYDPAPNALVIGQPATFVADFLIESLRESNGLEFMPPEQRLALIWELCKDEPYSFDSGNNVNLYSDKILTIIRKLML